jgi:putative ABC transport system substrate-binding protein
MKKIVARSILVAVVLGALLSALSLPAEAQQTGKIYRIGFLSGGFPGPSHWTTILRTELRKLGYIEGKNTIIESRYSENKRDRSPILAKELVRLKVDVIVTGGTNDTEAAKNATKTIPIVCLTLLDPIEHGFIASLAHPGGNITGFMTISDVLAGKRLELLKEVVPNLSRVAVIWTPRFPAAAQQWKENQRAAHELGLQLYSMEISSAERLEAAFEEAVKAGSTALSSTSSALISTHQRRIVQLAAKHRLAAVYDREEFVISGGLMSYGADESEHFRRVAVFVDKILKGAKPADIPVERPKEFELIINLKAAEQIGLTIPAECAGAGR